MGFYLYMLKDITYELVVCDLKMSSVFFVKFTFASESQGLGANRQAPAVYKLVASLQLIHLTMANLCCAYQFGIFQNNLASSI